MDTSVKLSVKNEKQNNKNNLKITEIMKKTAESINPSVESKETVWQRVLGNTKQNKSIFIYLKKSIGYAFTVVVLLGVGTLTMNIVSPQNSMSTYNSTPSDNDEFKNTAGIIGQVAPSKENKNMEAEYEYIEDSSSNRAPPATSPTIITSDELTEVIE